MGIERRGRERKGAVEEEGGEGRGTECGARGTDCHASVGRMRVEREVGERGRRMKRCEWGQVKYPGEEGWQGCGVRIFMYQPSPSPARERAREDSRAKFVSMGTKPLVVQMADQI